MEVMRLLFVEIAARKTTPLILFQVYVLGAVSTLINFLSQKI